MGVWRVTFFPLMATRRPSRKIVVPILPISKRRQIPCLWIQYCGRRLLAGLRAMQKLYCYVDETGQDTQGAFFLVSAVVFG